MFHVSDKILERCHRGQSYFQWCGRGEVRPEGINTSQQSEAVTGTDRTTRHLSHGGSLFYCHYRDRFSSLSPHDELKNILYRGL